MINVTIISCFMMIRVKETFRHQPIGNKFAMFKKFLGPFKWIQNFQA